MQVEGRALVSRASSENGGVHPSQFVVGPLVSSSAEHPACCILSAWAAPSCCFGMGGVFSCLSTICDCICLLALNSIFLGQVNHSTSCHAKHEVQECDNINRNFF